MLIRSTRGFIWITQDKDSECYCVQPGELPSARLPRDYVDMLDPCVHPLGVMADPTNPTDPLTDQFCVMDQSHDLADYVPCLVR